MSLSGFGTIINQIELDFDINYFVMLELIESWKDNIRRNVNSDFSISTMRRVAIIFFESGVVKNFMQKF